MKRWRMWSAGICLVALLVPGCAMFPGHSVARHPVPAALDWPAYDRERLPTPAVAILPPGTAVYSVASEQSAVPAEIWTAGAVAQRDAFWQRVLRDRCALREAMMVANGGKAEPDPICRAAVK